MVEHSIEHAVGIYIGLLMCACIVAIVSKRLLKLPYTIFLTVIGLVIGVLRWGPDLSEIGFGHDLIFFVFLPPLLFQGAFHMQLGQLAKHIWPIVCFAVPGVVVSTVLVGVLVWKFAGINSLLAAMVFGALISPTDPVSVLALFRKAKAPEGLRVLIEGESLFNDATGVVVFTILLNALITGQNIHPLGAVWQFLLVSGGGFMVGGILGLIALLILRKLEDHLLENTLCLVLAYGTFWVAEAVHVSGVIAVVMAGLLMGNQGRRLAMSVKTTETVETFFESIDFVLNSLLFILIGLELRELPTDDSTVIWTLIPVAIVAMLIGRAAVAYPFYWGLNQMGERRPKVWKHILFWGGLRGSIPIALLLHLPQQITGPIGGDWPAYRSALIAAGFGCVFFSLSVQGLTMGPLMRRLAIGGTSTDIKTRQMD